MPFARARSVRLASSVFACVLAALGAAQDADVDPHQRLESFRRYLAGAPYNERAFDGLVEAAREADGLGRLIDEYRAQLDAEPEDHATRAVLARLHARAGERAEALALLQANVEGDGRAALLAARIEFDAGHNGDALDLLLAAPPIEEPDALEDRLRFEAQVRLVRGAPGDREAAGRALVRVAELAPDDAAQQAAIASELNERGLTDEARKLLAAAAQRFAGDPERASRVLGALARIELGAGNEDAAIEAIRAATSPLARGHWLRRDLEGELLEVHRSADTLDVWIDECRAALEQAPHDLGAREALAAALAADQQPAQAAAVLAGALGDHPRDADLSARLRRHYAAADDEDGLFGEYGRALAEGLGGADLRYSYGTALARAGRLPAAMLQFVELAGPPQPRPDLLVQAARAWQGQNLEGRALELLAAGLAADPRERAYHALRVRILAALKVAAEEGAQEGADEVARRSAGAALERALDEAFGAAEGDVAACGECGDLALEVQDGARAARAYGAALLLGDSSPALHLRLAAAQLLDGKPDPARLALRRAVDGELDPALLRRALELYADSFDRPALLRRALTRERGAFEASPSQRAPGLFAFALLEAQGKRTEAKWMLSEHVARHADDLAARLRLVSLLIVGGEGPAALTHFDELIARFPARSRGFLLEKADLLIKLREYTEVPAALEAALAHAPGSPQLLSEVAGRYARIDREARALALHRKAVALAPREVSLRLALGRALLEARRWDEGEAQMLRCWREGSEEQAEDALDMLFGGWQRARVVHARVAAFRTRALGDPRDTEFGKLAVEFLVRSADLAGAVTLLSKQLDVAPRNMTFLRRRAELLYDLGRGGAALLDWDRVRRVEGEAALQGPEYVQVLLAGGADQRALEYVLAQPAPMDYLDLFKRLGDPSAGARLCAELLALPDAPTELHEKRGDFFKSAKDLDSAVASWLLALEADGGTADVLHKLARAHFEVDDEVRGLEFARRLLLLEPESTRTLHHFERHDLEYAEERARMLLTGELDPDAVRRFVGATGRRIALTRVYVDLLEDLRLRAEREGHVPASMRPEAWIEELHARTLEQLRATPVAAQTVLKRLRRALTRGDDVAPRDRVTFIALLEGSDCFPGADGKLLERLDSDVGSSMVAGALGLAYLRVADHARAEPFLARALAHPERAALARREELVRPALREAHSFAVLDAFTGTGVPPANLDLLGAATFRVSASDAGRTVASSRELGRAHAVCLGRLGRPDEARQVLAGVARSSTDELHDALAHGLVLVRAGLQPDADVHLAEVLDRHGAYLSVAPVLSGNGLAWSTSATSANGITQQRQISHGRSSRISRLFEEQNAALAAAWSELAVAFVEAGEGRRAFELLEASRMTGLATKLIVERDGFADACVAALRVKFDRARDGGDLAGLHAATLDLAGIHLTRDRLNAVARLLAEATERHPHAELLGLQLRCVELTSGAEATLALCADAIGAREQHSAQATPEAVRLGELLRDRPGQTVGRSFATWRQVERASTRQSPDDATPERLIELRAALDAGEVERALATLRLLLPERRGAAWTRNLFAAVGSAAWGDAGLDALRGLHEAAPKQLMIAERYIDLLLAAGSIDTASAVLDTFGKPRARSQEGVVIRRARQRIDDARQEADR